VTVYFCHRSPHQRGLLRRRKKRPAKRQQHVPLIVGAAANPGAGRLLSLLCLARYFSLALSLALYLSLSAFCTYLYFRPFPSISPRSLGLSLFVFSVSSVCVSVHRFGLLITPHIFTHISFVLVLHFSYDHAHSYYSPDTAFSLIFSYSDLYPTLFHSKYIHVMSIVTGILGNLTASFILPPSAACTCRTPVQLLYLPNRLLYLLPSTLTQCRLSHPPQPQTS